MIDLNDIAREVVENRKRRGWPSAHDLSKTTEGLAEELGEWAKARKNDNPDAMVDALVDLMVYCLGGLRILGCNSEKELLKVVETNKTREHTGHH